jgi:DNA replication and repair protein RecF
LNLRKLSLLNYKNYEEITLEFSSNINCFVGNNGVGKTNLLDAIYYLSMGKSYFNAIDLYNIRNNEDFFMIQGEYQNSKGGKEEITCSYKRNSRKILKKSKKEYERLSEHIGFIPIVMITPYDSSIITDGSEERRKFIDSIISQYNKAYLDNLIQYNRILQQRNRLLKNLSDQSHSVPLDMFDIYDEQLSFYGTSIYHQRLQFIQEFAPVFSRFYQYIASNLEEAELVYQSQLSSGNLNDLLKSNFGKDKSLEFTSFGIHKDDLQLLINGLPAKRIASQGQQKTFLVSLKLAEYIFLKNQSGQNPILLLDDIFDKFDAQRVKHIIELTRENDLGQIFITDTEQDRIVQVLSGLSNDIQIFYIHDNNATLIPFKN